MLTLALLTDFGITDTYVGVMKAVMRRICPDADFIDLTHAIQPQNVKQAAFTLLNSYHYFPAETVFLVVVDPGVGSARRAVAVKAGGFTFVAPDNGVLTYVLDELGTAQANALENEAYRLPQVSATFHGRDVFAPAAAHLACGVPLAQFGASVTDLVRLPPLTLTVEADRVRGEVVHIDHFGNIVTSIGRFAWIDESLVLSPRFGERDATHTIAHARVSVRAAHSVRVSRTYSDVEPGDVLALVGSSGYLELSINQGDAAARFGVSLGDDVILETGAG